MAKHVKTPIPAQGVRKAARESLAAMGFQFHEVDATWRHQDGRMGRLSWNETSAWLQPPSVDGRMAKRIEVPVR